MVEIAEKTTIFEEGDNDSASVLTVALAKIKVLFICPHTVKHLLCKIISKLLGGSTTEVRGWLGRLNRRLC